MSSVIFIGDSCEDIFYEGSSTRQSPEVNELKIFDVLKKYIKYGMASNTFGNFLNINSFLKGGFSSCLITNINEKPTKHRQYDSYGNMVHRFDENDKIKNDCFDHLKFKESINDETKFVIVSDYDKGFLSYGDIELIGKLCKKYGLISLIDTKKTLMIQSFIHYDFIKLNKLEYKNNINFIKQNKETFLDKLIITLGDMGCEYKEKLINTPYKIKDQNIYPEGCGDTFVAGFVFNYLKNQNIQESILFGMEMAGKVLIKKGVENPF